MRTSRLLMTICLSRQCLSFDTNPLINWSFCRVLLVLAITESQRSCLKFVASFNLQPMFIGKVINDLAQLRFGSTRSCSIYTQIAIVIGRYFKILVIFNCVLIASRRTRFWRLPLFNDEIMCRNYLNRYTRFWLGVFSNMLLPAVG